MNIRTRVGYLGVLIAAAVVASCADTNTPDRDDWESAGLEQVEVLEYELPDTVSTMDTLVVSLTGTTGGRPEFSRFDAVEESDGLELTAWAERWEWIGSGPCPPYDPTVRCEYRAAPLHGAGSYAVVMHQPDGGEIVDSVLVVPAP